MAKSPELTEQRFSVATLILSATALIIASFALLPAKAPWVDELYTWYGIRHETFGQFADSISSGVNFSPPLYFFLNWMVQLVVPLSLDVLRLESLLWVLGGAFLAHRAVRPVSGNLAAAAGVAVVLLQSALLREQALEARQYGMLFFCGAAVALSGSRLLKSPSCNNSQALHFLAHLALCLTHYLGIVFSVAAALAHMIARNRKDGKFGLPRIEMLTWAPAIILNLWLLSHQSSHLNTWAKANALADLASLYLDSFLPMTLAVPFLAFLLAKEKKTSTEPMTTRLETQVDRLHLVLLSLLWLTIPTGVWLLSHLAELNLFKARYFIPKEVGWMVLLSILLSKFPTATSPSFKNSLPHALLLPFSLAFLALATQRTFFSLHPSRNYYHSLIVDELFASSPLPKYYDADHLYFPNAYLNPSSTHLLLVPDLTTAQIYHRFSQETRTTIFLEKNLPSTSLLVTELPAEKIKADLLLGIDLAESTPINRHGKILGHHLKKNDRLHR